MKNAFYVLMVSALILISFSSCNDELILNSESVDNSVTPFYYYDKIEFTKSNKNRFISTLESKGLNVEGSIDVTKFKITKEDNFGYLIMFKPNNYAFISDIENFDESIFYSVVKHENHLVFNYYYDSENMTGILDYDIDNDFTNFISKNRNNDINFRDDDCLEGEFVDCMNDQYNTDTAEGWITWIATGFWPEIGVLGAVGCAAQAWNNCNGQQ